MPSIQHTPHPTHPPSITPSIQHALYPTCLPSNTPPPNTPPTQHTLYPTHLPSNTSSIQHIIHPTHLPPSSTSRQREGQGHHVFGATDPHGGRRDQQESSGSQGSPPPFHCHPCTTIHAPLSMHHYPCTSPPVIGPCFVVLSC